MPPGRCSISKKLILVIYKKDFISRQCYFNARTFTDAIFFHLFGNNDRRTKQGVSIQFSSVSVDLLVSHRLHLSRNSTDPIRSLVVAFSSRVIHQAQVQPVGPISSPEVVGAVGSLELLRPFTGVVVIPDFDTISSTKKT